MNKKVKVSFENFGVDKKKIENETDDKLTVKADNKLFFIKGTFIFARSYLEGRQKIVVDILRLMGLRYLSIPL